MALKAPDKTHDGNLNRTKVNAQPEAGTRQMKGKTNECDSALTDAKKYAPSAVTNPTVDKGAGPRAAKRQIEDAKGTPNGNPKKQVTGLFRQES